ncbi:hypothetical protein ACF053_14750 [Streptomyces kanasensis]|uniref:hypothetical protein n=1 Tax=Streptomyces kanasensis TaxID=936756 RepID=UPI0036FEFBC2
MNAPRDHDPRDRDRPDQDPRTTGGPVPDRHAPGRQATDPHGGDLPDVGPPAGDRHATGPYTTGPYDPPPAPVRPGAPGPSGSPDASGGTGRSGASTPSGGSGRAGLSRALGGTGHGGDPEEADGRPELTETEDLLVRALAARAGQLTPHSLRPASPPTVNWAARGRGPLVLALAASVAAVALVGGAAVSLLRTPDGTDVGDTPPSRVTAPPSLSPSPSGSPSTRASDPGVPEGSRSPSTGATAPSSPAGAVAPQPPEGETTPPSRTVTLVYGAMAKSTTLRTGGDGTVFVATVTNTLGEPAENASDVLTVQVAEGTGTLEPGDVKVSLRDGGTWQAVGSTGPSGVEARLTGPDGKTLGEDQERAHEVRIALGEGFPKDVTRLRITVFSDGGSEMLELGN